MMSFIFAFFVAASTSASAANCAKHAFWLDQILNMRGVDAHCQAQMDQATRALAQGLRMCQEINPDPKNRATCSPTVNHFVHLQDLAAQQTREHARTSAQHVVSQYQGLVNGMDGSGSCLSKLKGFRRDLSCGLSSEFGQLPPERNWWSDFWNREQSEAPFSDIPPWMKMGITTAATSVLWRYRGGGLFTDHSDSKSGQRRTITSLAFIGLGYFNGGLDGAITGGLMLPGLFVPYGEQMVMKERTRGVDQSEKWRNFGYMTGLGALTTAAPSTYLYARGYDPTAMVAGGAAKGLCYFGSWNWAPKAFADFPQKDFVGGVPTQTAELCSGATIGAGMSYSLLYGKKKPAEKPKPPPEKCEPPS